MASVGGPTESAQHPQGLTCKAEAPLCDKESTQTSGSQGAEYRNLDHRRAAPHGCTGLADCTRCTMLLFQPGGLRPIDETGTHQQWSQALLARRVVILGNLSD